MFKLPDDHIVNGDGWTLIGNLQWPLSRMSDAELAAIGVTRYESPPPTPCDSRFYTLSGNNLVARDIVNIRATLKAQAAIDRWQHELKGITLAGGKVVPADDTSLIRMLLAYVVARSNPAFTITNFRLVDGSYVNLTNAQIISVFESIATKILTTLYTMNKQIDTQIDALTTVEEAVAFTWSYN